MNKISCIIVEDEPKAIKLLESYISHYESLDLLASFRNGLKAIEFLAKTKVDVIFLDINMPHVSGTQIAKLIHEHSKIIFTTAYSEYAVESYELNAFDYLLKPISLDRFNTSVAKLLKEDFNKNSNKIEINEADTIIIKSGSSMHRTKIDDILFLEKDGNYMTYHTKGNKILARESINEALEKLPPHFIQCHKSYIINTSQVNIIEKHECQIGHHRVPVSQGFRSIVSNYFEQKR